MDTISQLQQDIERYDADALYYMGRAEHCQYEAALLRRELAQEQLRKGLDEAHAHREGDSRTCHVQPVVLCR